MENNDIGELVRNHITGSRRHPNYSLSVDIFKAVEVHAEGIAPERLISERRPSESEEIKRYRLKIYSPITMQPVNKVITSLGKIRRSPDWSVKFDPEAIPAKLKNNSLGKYTETEYPIFTSVTNWVFSELLKSYLIDPNGVYACIPSEMSENRADFIEPRAVFFHSDKVLAFKARKYAVLESSESVQYVTGSDYNPGKVYYVITDMIAARYERGAKGELVETYFYEHGLGYMPADKAGGLFYKTANGERIFKSRIESMIPSLNEAAREYSDLQAAIVSCLYPKEYMYLTEECPTCKGLGTAKDAEGKPIHCTTCNGGGKKTGASPYGVHIVSMSRKLDEYQVPAPPLGYVPRDVEIVKAQTESIKDHIYRALAAINMEFLAEVPLSQSGTAKEVDRDELNNFVFGVAEDIIRIMDNIYRWICDIRYDYAVPDAEIRKKMLPTINVPERYDLLSSTHLVNEIQAMRTAGSNPLIVRALEIDYVNKKFSSDIALKLELHSIIELDPLPGLGADEKMSLFAENVIREIDYIVSANIVRFVRKASEQNNGFFTMPFEAKAAILEKYANEIIASRPEPVTEPVEDGQYTEGS